MLGMIGIFIIGLLVGIIVTWAYEKRSYEIALKEVAETTAAVVFVLDRILTLLEIMHIENGGANKPYGNTE